MDYNCKGWLGRFGKPRCKFEPRYDISEPIMPQFGSVKLERFDPSEWKRETYVRDLCVKCGRTIERKA